MNSINGGFMKNRENITKLIVGFVIVSFAISCKTYSYDRENPYPGMEIMRYDNSQAYAFPNANTDKLIIVIEGSGWTSVLGEKETDIWTSVQYGAELLQDLKHEYTFLIPEKLNRQPGMVYFDDMDDRKRYTADNLIACYLESINGYLAKHSFSSIVLIGASEGAMLLPLLYEQMDNKDNVTALVSISYGGLSLHESFSILGNLPDLSQELSQFYYNSYMICHPENNAIPDSFEEDVYGLTFRWYKSFRTIRPYDYYKNINIPVLFVHGEYDYNIPAESTAYIQENLPEKPFTYKYFPWDHQTRNKADLLQLRKEIAEWIIETDK